MKALVPAVHFRTRRFLWFRFPKRTACNGFGCPECKRIARQKRRLIERRMRIWSDAYSIKPRPYKPVMTRSIGALYCVAAYAPKIDTWFNEGGDEVIGVFQWRKLSRDEKKFYKL